MKTHIPNVITLLNLLFGAVAGWSPAFIGGARAEIFFPEPELKKKYLEPESRKKAQVRTTAHEVTQPLQEITFPPQ